MRLTARSPSEPSALPDGADETEETISEALWEFEEDCNWSEEETVDWPEDESTDWPDVETADSVVFDCGDGT